MYEFCAGCTNANDNSTSLDMHSVSNLLSFLDFFGALLLGDVGVFKYVNHTETAHWKVLPCTEPASQANDFELIPTVRMKCQHSIGAPTCHHVPRFVIISEISRPEVRSR